MMNLINIKAEITSSVGRGSSASVREQDFQNQSSSSIRNDRHGTSSKSDRNITAAGSAIELEPMSQGVQGPSTVSTSQQQRWNSPKINAYRCFATFYAFIVMGANDAAYGAIIPYLEVYYNINFIIISFIFIAPLGGYALSAFMNNWLHMTFGQRGIAIAGPASHLLAYIVISQHPPYPALVVVCILAGFGNGIEDGAWNAWIGDMANANEVLGFLHAFYGVGAALAPLISTTLITQSGWQWYEFYYIMIGAAAIELLSSAWTFWGATSSVFRDQHRFETQPAERSDPEVSAGSQSGKRRFWQRSSTKGKSSSRTAEAVNNKITWLCSFFLLFYVGAEVAIGGWVVVFMLNVRHGSHFASGMVSTGFWLGITLGRIVLGFVTARLFKTEKHAIAAYLVACMALELVFWLVPQFIVSAVAASLLGFFLGPMFPAAVIAATKLLPKHLHVAAIGFAAALGMMGACILPFVVGVLAQAKGVQVLQPIILALLVVCLGFWLWIPKLPKVRTA